MANCGWSTKSRRSYEQDDKEVYQIKTKCLLHTLSKGSKSFRYIITQHFYPSMKALAQNDVNGQINSAQIRLLHRFHFQDSAFYSDNTYLHTNLRILTLQMPTGIVHGDFAGTVLNGFLQDKFPTDILFAAAV